MLDRKEHKARIGVGGKGPLLKAEKGFVHRANFENICRNRLNSTINTCVRHMSRGNLVNVLKCYYKKLIRSGITCAFDKAHYDV